MSRYGGVKWGHFEKLARKAGKWECLKSGRGGLKEKKKKVGAKLFYERVVLRGELKSQRRM